MFLILGYLFCFSKDTQNEYQCLVVDGIGFEFICTDIDVVDQMFYQNKHQSSKDRFEELMVP